MKAEPDTTNIVKRIVVVATLPREKSPVDAIAALRSLGDIRPLEATRFRFEWSPVLGSFGDQLQTAAQDEFESTVTMTAEGWCWEIDPNPLTTGLVLWRTANAIRLLALLSVMVDRHVVKSWCMRYDGAMLAAHEGPGKRVSLVTERFAELVAGEFGRAAFLAVPPERFISGISHEDEATLTSERTSTLIATFIEDQLAVRPPITQAEVDQLKRRLGAAGQIED